MKNKKVIIAIVIVLVLVVAAVAGVLIFKPFDKEEEDKTEKTNTAKTEEKNDKKDVEEDVDYEAILEKFLDACKSEEDMDKFVEDYVDIKSLYVSNQVESPSEFNNEYDKVKEKEYEDYIDTAKEDYHDFVAEDVELTLKKVGNVIKMSEVGIDIWSDVRFTVDNDGDTEKLAAIFCKDKLVLVVREDEMEKLYDSIKEQEDEANNTTNSARSNTTKDSDENVTNTSNKVSNKTTSSSYFDDEEE